MSTNDMHEGAMHFHQDSLAANSRMLSVRGLLTAVVIDYKQLFFLLLVLFFFYLFNVAKAQSPGCKTIPLTINEIGYSTQVERNPAEGAAEMTVTFIPHSTLDPFTDLTLVMEFDELDVETLNFELEVGGQFPVPTEMVAQEFLIDQASQEVICWVDLEECPRDKISNFSVTLRICGIEEEDLPEFLKADGIFSVVLIEGL
ncbi:MAG: hypothetical protein AAF998_15090 [Bacteroidota bacterium]